MTEKFFLKKSIFELKIILQNYFKSGNSTIKNIRIPIDKLRGSRCTAKLTSTI